MVAVSKVNHPSAAPSAVVPATFSKRKAQGATKAVRLTLTDFVPKRAGQYVLAGSALQASDLTVNGQQLTQANIATAYQTIQPAAAQACADNVVTLPPYSVSLFIFAPK